MQDDDLVVALRPLAIRLGALDRTQGDDRGDRGGGDGLTLLIDDEAAVGIAIEGEAEIGSVLDDGLLQVDDVGGVERVGFVIREGAVELEVERHDVERQCREPGSRAENGGDRESAHPIPRVDDHLERADAGQIDE